MRPPPDGVSTGNVIANTWSEHNPAYAELVGYMKLHHFWMATSPKGGFDAFNASMYDFLATRGRNSEKVQNFHFKIVIFEGNTIYMNLAIFLKMVIPLMAIYVKN